MPRLALALALAAVAVPAGCGGGQRAEGTTTVTVFRLQHGALHAERAEVPAARSTPDLAAGRVAEVVYTLTRLSAVRKVDVAGRRALTRADVAAYVPPILIESPADGQQVPSTFTVRGTASVFEATLVVELRRGGTLLERRTVTATNGAPARGDFATVLSAAAGGPATVVAYAPGAADGSPQHLQRVPVTVLG